MRKGQSMSLERGVAGVEFPEASVAQFVQHGAGRLTRSSAWNRPSLRRRSHSTDIVRTSRARARSRQEDRTGVAMRSLASYLLALVLSTSACAAPAARSTPETATHASATPSATLAPRAHVTVAMGTKGSLILLPWELAKALNYFDEANIDLELQYAPNATQAAAALVAGTADFGGSSLDHSIRAQLQGKPTRMIVSFARLPGVALVAR